MLRARLLVARRRLPGRPYARAWHYHGPLCDTECWNIGWRPAAYRPPRHDRGSARASAADPGGPSATRSRFLVAWGDARGAEGSHSEPCSAVRRALCVRVAALEQGPTRLAVDGASSSDDVGAAPQRSKLARSAAGKARPRSSSPAPAMPSPDSRPRATSAQPPLAAHTAGSDEELVLLRIDGLPTRSMTTQAWKPISGAHWDSDFHRSRDIGRPRRDHTEVKGPGCSGCLVSRFGGAPAPV